MIFAGKVIGAFFGMLFGLPGFIIGIIVGHYFDKMILGAGISINRSRVAFFTATFSIMGHIAKSNGKVKKESIELATRIMGELGLTLSQKRLAKELFRQGKEPVFNIDWVLQQLIIGCGGSPNLLNTFVEIQVRAVLVDGEISESERQILIKICRYLHVSEQKLAYIINSYTAGRYFNDNYSNNSKTQSDPNNRVSDEVNYMNACKILGVDGNASKSDIKRAYRKLMSQHHPDKLVSKGLPKEMMQMAKARAQEITSAYDVISKKRNF